MMLARRGKAFVFALAALEKMDVQFVCALAGKSKAQAVAKTTAKIRLNSFIVKLDCGRANPFKAIQFVCVRLPKSGSSGIFIATIKLGIVARITHMKKCL